jgi:hypothetical protein
VAAAGLVLGQHRVRVGLTFGGVGVGDGVDDGLGFLVADFCDRNLLAFFVWERFERVLGERTLVVVNHVTEVVAAAVVRLAHAHRVVREVDIAVVAEDCDRERLALVWQTRWVWRAFVAHISAFCVAIPWVLRRTAKI